MLNEVRQAQLETVRHLVYERADRIAMEFAARANDGMSLTCDDAVQWLKRELAGFSVAVSNV